MNELDFYDLQFALRRTPRQLLKIMKRADWYGRIFVGGGFLRSVVAGDPVNDVDVFVTNHNDAWTIARMLCELQKNKVLTDSELARAIFKTDNALTVRAYQPEIQIIHRWVFDSAEAVSNSFDFTCCCAAFWFDGHNWQSTCDPRFYLDNAAKRLVYRSPVRNEDAGGSALRVLKYYQKGYRIPLDSMGKVLARLFRGVKRPESMDENELARVLTGLLRVVDPLVDPTHEAHLPSADELTDALVDAEETKG